MRGRNEISNARWRGKEEKERMGLCSSAINDGTRPGLSLANTSKNLDDDESQSDDESKDGSYKVISVIGSSMAVIRNDKKDAKEDEHHSLASPSQIESHKNTKLLRHENLYDNNISREKDKVDTEDDGNEGLIGGHPKDSANEGEKTNDASGSKLTKGVANDAGWLDTKGGVALGKSVLNGKDHTLGTNSLVETALGLGASKLLNDREGFGLFLEHGIDFIDGTSEFRTLSKKLTGHAEVLWTLTREDEAHLGSTKRTRNSCSKSLFRSRSVSFKLSNKIGTSSSFIFVARNEAGTIAVLITSAKQ